MHNLMQGLGQLLQIDLREDFNQSCTLNMDGIKVQMELDSPGEFLLLMTFISELPPGQFRETVLKEALKVNYTVEQKIGTLSYIKKENVLVLCHTIRAHALTAEALLEQLLLFYDRAKAWKDAIHSGRTAPDTEIVIKQRDRLVF